MPTLSTQLTLERWDEKIVIHHDGGDDGARISSVDGIFQYSGDMEGTSTMHLTLQYDSDGTGFYIGWERFEGSILGKSGSILLKQEGRFEAHGVVYSLTTVPGSGMSGLSDLSVHGQVEMQGIGPYELTLELAG